MPCRFDYNCFSEGRGWDKDSLVEARNSVQRITVHSVGLRSRLLLFRMNVERMIGDIEQPEEMSDAPDIRPLSASDVSAANRSSGVRRPQLLGVTDPTYLAS